MGISKVFWNNDPTSIYERKRKARSKALLMRGTAVHHMGRLAGLELTSLETESPKVNISDANTRLNGGLGAESAGAWALQGLLGI